MIIRPAHHDDLPAMRHIAAAGGSPDADDLYLGFVSTSGRLLVAADTGGSVIGFAGSVAVGDTAMVADLFVDEDRRGRGVGASLLAAVTDGWASRMTFSSTNPGAVPTYVGAGMDPRWDLLTLRGPAGGGGEPLAEATWRHDRRDLVEYFRRRGATVGSDSVVMLDEICTVLRLVSDVPIDAAASLLASLPAGAAVEWSLPEPHPLAAWLRTVGFTVVDRDVFCSTDGILLPPNLCSVHRGLM